jgi:hypothetical protein
MIRKSLEEFLIVALKFFFDIEYAYCSHAFLIAIILSGMVKMYFSNCVRELHIGCQTVLKDARTFRVHIVNVKRRLDQKNVFSTLRMQIRNLKEAVTERISVN